MKSHRNGIRFAPSPTGNFHIGNLRTAWISAQFSCALSEPLVFRVEDIDTLRVRVDSWKSQSADLAALGIIPDQIIMQSQLVRRHAELFEKARHEKRVYPCDCSRREVLAQLAIITSAPHAAEQEYSGHCRHRDEDLTSYHPKETLAWRWKSASVDGAHDPIIARTAADGSAFTPGYHWACAIDDGDGDYHVLVRAWDLANADIIQREIRRWVSTTVDPVVFHTALVTQNDGHRLEKRTQGTTLAEIQSRGISIATLIEHFAASFNLPVALEMIHARRSRAGEGARSVTLSQLSL